MKRELGFAIGAVAVVNVLAFVAWWSGRTPPPVVTPARVEPATAATPAVVAEPSEPLLSEIAMRLGEEQRRESALKELQKVRYQRIGDLGRLAAKIQDPRVAGDLRQRAIELEEEVSASPPGVSIDLQNGSLADLIDLLNEEMGTDIIKGPVALVPPQTFTVHAVKKPFWEVVGQAADQHPLSFNGFTQLFLAEDLRGMPYRAVVGPFCVYASILDNKPIAGRPAPATPRPLKWTFRYTLGIDPRIRVVGAKLAVTMSTDDAGNVLLKDGEAFELHPTNFLAHSTYAEAELKLPEHAGKRVEWVKLKGQISVATSELETTVELGEPGERQVQLGDVSIGMRIYVIKDIGRTDLVLTPKGADGKVMEARFRILDNVGTRVNRLPNGTYQVNFPKPPASDVKVEMWVPRKVEARDVEFVIRDIALPG